MSISKVTTTTQYHNKCHGIRLCIISLNQRARLNARILAQQIISPTTTILDYDDCFCRAGSLKVAFYVVTNETVVAKDIENMVVSLVNSNAMLKAMISATTVRITGGLS